MVDQGRDGLDGLLRLAGARACASPLVTATGCAKPNLAAATGSSVPCVAPGGQGEAAKNPVRRHLHCARQFGQFRLVGQPEPGRLEGSVAAQPSPGPGSTRYLDRSLAGRAGRTGDRSCARRTAIARPRSSELPRSTPGRSGCWHRRRPGRIPATTPRRSAPGRDHHRSPPPHRGDRRRSCRSA